MAAGTVVNPGAAADRSPVRRGLWRRLQEPNSPRTSFSHRAPALVLGAITAVFCAWVLSLPSFPTTDGPVHMYYVHVLDRLLAHDPLYAHFFRIRHLVPPYSLYYYALLLLSRALPMLLADRLIICAYILSFVFGFRFLAREIGPRGDLMAGLSTPLLLNWPLGMGFVNFCLSLSFSFWAAGLWLRFEGRSNLRARVAFLLLVTGIMLTHPVPLLLLLAVVGALWAARMVQSAARHHRLMWPAAARADLLTLLLAALNLGYVRLFASANPLRQINETGQPAASFGRTVLQQLTLCPREHALAFVFGHSLDIVVYRAVLLAILVLAATLALRERRRNHRAGCWTTADTFTLLAVGLFGGLPLIPPQLNGLYFFADRLVLCVWLAFLLAASGSGAAPAARRPEAGYRVKGLGQKPFSGLLVACVVLTLVGDVTLLSSANRILRPAARAIAELQHTGLALQGQVGVLMEDARPTLGQAREGLAWNPYHWALLQVFRQQDAILANAPWMHESIIPVAPSAALPEVSIAALQEPFMNKVQESLLRSPEDLRRTLGETTFFLVNQADEPAWNGVDPLLRASRGGNAGRWHCAEADWYRSCEEKPSAGAPGF